MEVQVIDEEEGERKYPARKRTAVAPPPGTASPGARYQNETVTSPTKIAKLDAPPKSKKSKTSQKSTPRPSLTNVKKLLKQTEDQNKNVTHSSPQGLSPFAKLWRCQLTLKNTFPCNTCGRLLASAEALHQHEAMHENADTSINRHVPSASTSKIATSSPVITANGPLTSPKPLSTSTTPSPVKPSKLSNSFTPNVSKVAATPSSRNPSPSKATQISKTPSSANPSPSKVTQASPSSSTSSPAKMKPANASSEGRPFYCEVCRLYFSSKRSLNRHRNREIHLQHVGGNALGTALKVREPPEAVPANGYPESSLNESVSSEGSENSSPENSNSLFCDVCQQALGSRASLKRHLKTVGHKARENSNRATPTPPTTPKSPALNGSSPVNASLTCSVCQKTYSTKSNHKRHYLTHFK